MYVFKQIYLNVFHIYLLSVCRCIRCIYVHVQCFYVYVFMNVLCIYFYVFFSLHVFICSSMYFFFTCIYFFICVFIYLFMYLCIYIHTIFVREVDESARDVILKALPAGSFCKCAAKSAA